MSTILIIVLVILLLGGFGGYHGYSRYGGPALGGVLGLVLIVIIVLWLVGGVHVWSAQPAAVSAEALRFGAVQACRWTDGGIGLIGDLLIGIVGVASSTVAPAPWGGITELRPVTFKCAGAKTYWGPKHDAAERACIRPVGSGTVWRHLLQSKFAQFEALSRWAQELAAIAQKMTAATTESIKAGVRKAAWSYVFGFRPEPEAHPASIWISVVLRECPLRRLQETGRDPAPRGPDASFGSLSSLSYKTTFSNELWTFRCPL